MELAGADDVLDGLPVYTIAPGESGELMFDVTALPTPKGSVTVYDLESLGDFSVSSGWDDTDGSGTYHATEDRVTAPEVVTMELTVGAGVPVDDYLVSSRVGFQGAQATGLREFYVRVAHVPEPATLAMLLGVCAAGLVWVWRRK